MSKICFDIRYSLRHNCIDIANVTALFQKSPYKATLFLLLILTIFPSNSHQKRLLRPRDDCYDDDRNPKFCQPEFENVALNKKAVVSETCGIPHTEPYCGLEERNREVTRICDHCDPHGPRAHPATFLTDINDNGNVTYWQSKPVEGRRDVVTLTVSFEKKYELSYVSLQFHSPRPEAMIIYKSVNHGRTWTPYQFYARNCQLRFGLPNHAQANHTGDHEALCLEDSSDPRPLSGGRILFNPTRYRPSESNFENSHVLQDWVTATDIRIVLTGVNDVEGVLPPLSSGFTKRRAGARALKTRGSRKFSKSGSMHHNHHNHEDASLPFSHRKGLRRSAPAEEGGSPPASVSQYAFGSSHFYAINDVTIGGRCKCNGHASRCLIKKGRLVCDCKHNTDGPNCEKCKAFHFDRPWKSATRTNPNPCVACNCNLHAKKCRFNADLFVKSGGVSGGVCQKCRHHTTGRFCHICKPGYYKNNKTKSLAHRKICKTCGCHPVGAAGKICHPTTGQCPCKEGVAGKKCNRCAKGYQQTPSRIAPCIKFPSAHPSPDRTCGSCKKSRSIQLPISKLCKFDYAIQTRVVEVITDGKIPELKLDIIRDYKKSDFSRRELVDVRVRDRALSCFCPRLKKNRKYLILGNYRDHQVTIDKTSVAIRWRTKYKKKLLSLMEQAQDVNRC